MQRRYRALLRGDRLEWLSEAPNCEGDHPVSVVVTILEDGSLAEETFRGPEMAAILEKIAETGAFAEVKDPLVWQRKTREDRPLPGRTG